MQTADVPNVYDWTIDWGDGTNSRAPGPTADHTYTTPGERTVTATANVDEYEVPSGDPTEVSSHGAVAVAKALSVASGGTLDLKDNDLVVLEDTYDDIESLVIDGFHSGDWLGDGITSSVAADDPDSATALGIASNDDLNLASFGGQTLSDDEVIVRYTYYGDANLDGTVDPEDEALFIEGLDPGNTDPKWFNGDFDYSGDVDAIDDYAQFLLGLEHQGQPKAAPSVARTLVPLTTPLEATAPVAVVVAPRINGPDQAEEGETISSRLTWAT